jgi:hypothetical protein
MAFDVLTIVKILSYRHASTDISKIVENTYPAPLAIRSARRMDVDLTIRYSDDLEASRWPMQIDRAVPQMRSASPFAGNEVRPYSEQAVWEKIR